MTLADFKYHLPPELIGQVAIEPRDSCKLMVVDRKNQQISHHIFRDLLEILDENSVLVLNDTKVFPARLFGTKESGGKIEVLLLKQLSPNSFSCLVKGKINSLQQISFHESLVATITKDEDFVLTFNLSGPELLTKIDELGKTPLPPYIKNDTEEKTLREQYQTVYADKKGSAAAPTAGLHFTDKLLLDLTNRGVQVEKITLHVGLGTFKPVTEEQIASKTLHTEQFEIDEETASQINLAKSTGKKIIAVGTTSCRVLESQTNDQGVLQSGRGDTNIFIQPGYKFKLLDGLITNFHFPETSLLMLVSAFTSYPNSPLHFKTFQQSLVGRGYQEAVEKKYKFFSFGDAMLIT